GPAPDDGPAPDGDSAPDPDSAPDRGTAADGEGETPEVPTGAQQAQPQGTTVPFDAPDAPRHLEVTFGEVRWDVDDPIADTNPFTAPRAERNRYLMVTPEARYRGSGSFSAYVRARLEHVAEDGTGHAQNRIATPNHVSGGHGQLR